MKLKILAICVLGVCAITAVLPRIAQDPRYHLMADGRSFAGLPNALDVLSNLPFFVVGGLGVWTVTRARRADVGRARWPWIAFFAATTATTFGSMYYHLHPDNARVVWDRLPIAMAFASLLCAVVADRVDRRWALGLIPLLLLSAVSVLFWYWTELAGDGDLRPYLGVQFGSLVILVAVLVLYPEPRTDRRFLMAGLAAYAIAKACEMADAEVFQLTRAISGHTLKHFFAAAMWRSR